MFGYVRIFKPQLKVCEYDTYKAFYCGLCKKIKKEYGFLATLTLSYDFAFLSLINSAVNDYCASASKCRCIAHPIKKTICISCDEGLNYPAAAAEILIYHKLRDDVSDKGLLKKLTARFLLLFLKRGYKKAKLRYPVLADEVEKQMKEQKRVEAIENCSVDLASEPSAKMMEAIADNISTDEAQRRVLRRFGYFLGRYIYLCDAADDLADDIKKSNFNPIINEFSLSGQPDEKDSRKICDYITQSINLTLGELANCYTLLDLHKYKPILDNIIYLGLKNSLSMIINEKLIKEKGNEL